MRACASCGRSFQPAKNYHKSCRECWKADYDEQLRDEGYRRGYAHGFAEARRSALNGADLRDVITLTHPDRHPPERRDQATKVTAQLLELRRAS